LAAELVRLKVDLIIASAGTQVATAAKNATETIPIVMIFVRDPVGTGLIASLARPGGNVTGTTAVSSLLGGKRLELLKETLPKLARVAVLVNPDWAPDLAQRLPTEMQTNAALGAVMRGSRTPRRAGSRHHGGGR
jgi:putative ABC transport system substrate-binding protein